MGLRSAENNYSRRLPVVSSTALLPDSPELTSGSSTATAAGCGTSSSFSAHPRHFPDSLAFMPTFSGVWAKELQT